MRALEGINLDALRRRMQRAPDDDYGLDLKMLDPAAVDYSLPDILSSPLSRRDALILGGGTVATTLIAVLAQSALKGSTAGSSAFLVACLAWVLWIALLLFVYAVPGDTLLKRGPAVAGTIGWPLPDLVSDLTTLYLRAIMAISGLGLCVLTYLLTADNLFRPAGVATWLLSILFWMLALADDEE